MPFAGPLPPGLAAGANQFASMPAVGAPLLVAGGAQAPTAATLTSYQLVSSLLGRLSGADLVMLHNFDDLVRILAPPPGPPPMAFLPASSIDSRCEYIDERLIELTANGPMPPVNGTTWREVFQTARSLVRTAAGGASASAASASMAAGSLSNSFGARADRHLMAQQAVLPQWQPGVAAASSAQPALDPIEATAIRAAATAIDQEGNLGRAHQVMGAAVGALMPAAPTDLQSVQQLGARMANLPNDVQIIESAGQGRFAATSSAHMQSLSLTLLTATSTFYKRASRDVRLHVAHESELISEARQTVLRTAIADVFRGKPLQVSELRLSGAGGDSLFTSLRAGDISRAIMVMGWMDFIVRLIESAQSIAVSDPGLNRTFFSAAATRISQMVHIDRLSPTVIADWVEHRLQHMTRDFRDFFAQRLLLRPKYSPSYLEDAVAQAALRDIKEQAGQAATSNANIGALVDAHLAMRLAGAGAGLAVPAAPTALAAGVAAGAAQAAAPAPAGVHGRRRNRNRAAAAAAPAAAAVTPAAAAVVPAAAPVPPVAPPGFVVPPANLPATVAPAVPRVRPAAAVNPVRPAAPFVGTAAREVMTAFTAGHLDAAGRGRCFNFFQRGVCHNGSECRFSHE